MDADKIIVKQIIEGNTELFPNLVNKYYPKITDPYSICRTQLS